MATDSEAQTHLDEEITGQVDEIAKQIIVLCNLHTRRNAFSPVSRLPAETLSTIFIHCAHDYHCGDFGLGHFTSTVPCWVNVSYVCRHWRNVALTCATLWTYIFVTSPRWTEELLARSKQAPLKLHVLMCQDRKSYGLHPVEEVMVHVARLQELHLYLPPTLICDVFSKLSSSAPRLQTLKICVDDASPERLSAPFRGDTPALHKLHLTHCPVPWYSFKLSSLTTLDVSGVPGQFQQSTFEFLVTLSSMQHLTQLNLEDALASAVEFLSSAAFNAYQKIDLPHLSRLAIAAPLSTVITLLSCVIVPSKTVVRLKCDSEHSSSLDHRVQLSSVLAQRLSVSEDQALSSTVIRTLVIEDECGETGLTFSGLERDHNDFYHTMHWDWNRDNPLQIFFDSELSMGTSNGDNIMSDICCSIPFPNVQSLHACTPPYSPAFWKKMLGHFEDLRHLKLSVGNMPDIASALSAAGPSTHEDEENQGGNTPSDQARNRILVPRLEELELEGIAFSPEDHPDTSGRFITLSRLCDALSTRNVPVGQLSLTQCEIPGMDEPHIYFGLWDNIEVRVTVSESDSDSD